MKRSDLICENGVINDKREGIFVHNFKQCRTDCTEVIIDKNASVRLKKPVGRYITIYCDSSNYGECFCNILADFTIPGRVLVAGLGNEKICSDSLGAKAIRYIPATAHLAHRNEFKELNLREVFVIGTSVAGKTGLESAEQIKCIADNINAELIIVIDSLACSELERLCRTIQITDTGIAPGAGVGNSRKELNQRTTGRKVIAVGIPTVIDYGDENDTLMVTPRNIDIIVDEFAKTIGYGISRALNPTLSAEEINALIIL